MDRRRFLGTAALGAVAVGLPRIGSSQAGISPSLGLLKQVDAGALSIGYAELGRSSGRPVILLHGWPYDVHTFEGVAPLLASAGYRTLVPYLRGYDAVSFNADAPEWSAVGARRRRHLLHGCA